MTDVDPFDALSGFAHRFARGGIPDASLDVMWLCLFDWAICGLGAVDDPITQAMMDHAGSAGSGPCGVFHNGVQTTARMAALVNGTVSHALDFDDTHFGHIGHVSTVVIPTALAVAQAEGRDFDAFINAAQIGAEAAVRVGVWLGRSHYQAGWHQTATAGAYGAAVAAAVLMDAPVRATLSIVAGTATGQKAQFGSAMKPLNAGLAAANGVEAAQLAKAGLSGSDDIFAGVLATQAGEGNVRAFDRLGEDWLFDTVSHKYHACCHGTHAMIEGLLALGSIDPAQIDRIDVTTHPRWMTVCDKPDPKTWLEGKFSYRFLAALTLCGGHTIGTEPDGYFPISPQTRDLMARTIVTADDAVAETATVIDVTFKDGRARAATYDLATPEPLMQRREKLMLKGRKLLGPGKAEDVMKAIEGRDLTDVMAVIRRTC